MAKIGWGILCENLFISHGGKPIVEAPINLIKLNAFPNNYTFFVIYSIIDLEHDTEHKIEMVVGELDSNKELTQGDMTFKTDEELPEYNGKLGSFIQHIQLQNLTFYKAGTHYIDININKQDTPFRILFDVQGI